MHMPVTVVNWNPSRRIVPGKLGRLLPFRRPLNNFGDLLGPRIVSELIARQELQELSTESRLLAVGSILRLARDGDVVWGTGANGKSLSQPFPFDWLDVRAVRGPLTRTVLSEIGVLTPEVYGDPGLLVGHLWSRERLAAASKHPKRDLLVVPNFHDYPKLKSRLATIRPTLPLGEILGAIAKARFVVGSSLHGIIVAESLGIPARAVRSATEPEFKYQDYYLGTGRESIEIAEDIETAIAMGGAPMPGWDPQALLKAFPSDLWQTSRP